MADNALTLKQHDTRPVLVATLLDSYGLPAESAINLSAASQVRFIMRVVGLSDEAPPKVNGPMTIVDAANGIVQYNWATGDLDTNGTYNVEFEIHWSDGTVETVPSDGYLSLTVADDLG